MNPSLEYRRTARQHFSSDLSKANPKERKLAAGIQELGLTVLFSSHQRIWIVKFKGSAGAARNIALATFACLKDSDTRTRTEWNPLRQAVQELVNTCRKFEK